MPEIQIFHAPVGRRALAVMWLIVGCSLHGTAYAEDEPPPPRNRTGFISDKPENYAARPATSLTRAPLPSEVDLSSYFPPPGSQGSQSSCTAWSTAYARSYYESVMNNADVSRPTNIVSPAYIYNATHPQASSCDEGTSFAAALGVLARGALSLQDFPYNAKNCFVSAPDPSARGESRFRIAERIEVIRSKSPTAIEIAIKQTLASGRPVLFAMNVDERFDRFRKYYIRNRAERCDRNFQYTEAPAKNGHAMVIVGYSNARQAFKVLNSWGADWGCDGFVWVAFDTVTTTAKADEYYIFSPPNASPQRLQEVAKGVSKWGDQQSEDQVRKTIAADQPDPPKDAPVAPVAAVPPAVVQQQLNSLLLAEMRESGCALLAGKVDGQARNAIVAGILPSSSALDRLKGRLKGLQAVQRIDMSRVKIRAWPQCEAIIALLPILEDEGRLQLTVGGQNEVTLRAGEPLRLEAVSPYRQAYLYIVYLQVGGEAVPVFKSGRPLPPRTRISYPFASATVIPRVAAPFGDEMAIALASSERLPELEGIGQATDREFLTVLENAIRNAQQRGQLQLSAAIVPVKTVER